MADNKTIEVDGLGPLSMEELSNLIRIAETSERYNDMSQYIKSLIEYKSKYNIELDIEERNLLSVAYKNIVGSQRASLRVLSNNVEFSENELKLINNKYKIKIENELEVKCKEILTLLIEKVLSMPSIKTNNNETKVFYLKMIGDYYRYLAEFKEISNLNSEYKIKSQEYYENAMIIAKNSLETTNPTRLGLILNYSVCYYEILKKPEKACQLAKDAFDSAIDLLDKVNENMYKDVTLIMQLIRDNLTLWESEQEEQDDN